MTKVEKILFDINHDAIKQLEDLINKMFLPTDDEKLAWLNMKYKDEYRNAVAYMIQEGSNGL